MGAGEITRVVVVRGGRSRMPSLPRMAVELAKSAAEVARHAASTGRVRSGNQELTRRLEVCRGGCEHWAQELGRCSKCGCWMRWKAALEAMRCPVGKWEQLESGKGER